MLFRLKKRLALVLLSLAVAPVTHAQEGANASAEPITFESALAFNHFVVSLQKNIIERVLAFGNDPEIIENKARGHERIDAIMEASQDGIDALDRCTPYGEGEEFRKQARALFVFYLRMADTQYRELIGLLGGGDPSTNDDSDTRIQVIVDDITQEEAKWDRRFQQAQQAYAKRYGFRLQRNSLQDDIDALNED